MRVHGTKWLPGIHLAFMLSPVKLGDRGSADHARAAGRFTPENSLDAVKSRPPQLDCCHNPMSFRQDRKSWEGEAGSKAVNALGKREKISVKARGSRRGIAPVHGSQKVGANRTDMPFGELNEVECG